MLGYKTSKDYNRLRTLLDKGYEVVCFVTYDFLHGREKKPMMTTDVCIGRVLSKDSQYERYSFGCRGTTFIDHWLRLENINTFEDELKFYQLEFIDIEDGKKK